MNYPYNDDFMYFDERRGRYTLTEAALLSRGINLRARIGAAAEDQTTIITAVLTASRDMVYRALHKYARDTVRQDQLIATIPDLRDVFFEILLNQAEYYIKVGDKGKSEDPNRGRLMMYEGFDDDISEYIPCIGMALVQIGG
jgi:hypothetical protein